MQNKVLIINFGSEYTQLIARKVRAQGFYCEIHPYNSLPADLNDFKAVILADSPVSNKKTAQFNIDEFRKKVPLLAIGAPVNLLLGKSDFETSSGTKILELQIEKKHKLFSDVANSSEVLLTEFQFTTDLPAQCECIAKTEEDDCAAFQVTGEDSFGILFHPEVHSTIEGAKILQNFLARIANLEKDWTSKAFAASSVRKLKQDLGSEKVVLGLSGGVDSTVTAVLLHKAIGKNLHCIFVNHGLLRKDEFSSVLKQYEHLGLNVKGVDASDRFLGALEGVTDPEKKRKIIGKYFIEVFEEEAQKLDGVKYLGQGTIYPDIIESISLDGSVAVKSHHNVGGLPERMNLKIIEPIKTLFKDEVRNLGKELGVKTELIGRHPFPGPGLAIRIIGEITRENLRMLQEADAIFIDNLRRSNLYDKVWQAGAILLPINSVGVTNDKRTYEKVIALRAVQSVDGMTADWVDLPYDFLKDVSNQIIREVEGINRVVYDISSKPPATIEWE